jgi:serine phosphatase RsbU (regulator of sigma subunit)
LAIVLVSEIEFKSKSIRFGKDDILLLYTDGLIEGRDQNDEEFSEARLSDYLKKNNHLSAPFFWIPA